MEQWDGGTTEYWNNGNWVYMTIAISIPGNR